MTEAETEIALVICRKTQMEIKDKEQKDCRPFKKANEENANFSSLLVRTHKQETQTQLE
jgi:hypothetical protein